MFKYLCPESSQLLSGTTCRYATAILRAYSGGCRQSNSSTPPPLSSPATTDRHVCSIWFDCRLVDTESVGTPASKTYPSSCHRAWQFENSVKAGVLSALAVDWPDQMHLDDDDCNGNMSAAEVALQMAHMAAGLIGSNGSRSFWPVEILPPGDPATSATKKCNGEQSDDLATAAGAFSIDDLVDKMDCDHSVTRVKGTPGGSTAGYQRAPCSHMRKWCV